MSAVLQIGPNWHGSQKIKRLVVFGDSYSSVANFYSKRPPRLPSTADPLGVPFPGENTAMWNEPGSPNWVGHFITKYCAPPRYQPQVEAQDGRYNEDPLLVYDYAVGGDRLPGLQRQIQRQFLPYMTPGPDAPALWTPDDSLFVTWIGIDDCALAPDVFMVTQLLGTLFELQEQLYAVGARNFLFIDLPPMNRTPAAKQQGSWVASTITTWNASLKASIRIFVSTRLDITALLFSASATFDDFLDNPVVYGFKSGHVHKHPGQIWHDQLHPTSRVHDILAEQIAEFLECVVEQPLPGAEEDAACIKMNPAEV